MTKYGAVNLHFSLLPKYRGAAPVQWAIIEGEKKTGVSLFILDSKMDHGDIIYQKELNIEEADTTETLGIKLVVLGLEGFKNIFSKSFKENSKLSQNHALASPARKLKKEDGRVDWNKDATTIQCQIRGMFPYPIAYGELSNGKKNPHTQSRNSQKRICQKNRVFNNDRRQISIGLL